MSQQASVSGRSAGPVEPSAVATSILGRGWLLALLTAASCASSDPSVDPAGPVGASSLIARLQPSDLRAEPSEHPALQAAGPTSGRRILSLDELENPKKARRTLYALELWSNGSFLFQAEIGPGGSDVQLLCSGTTVGGTGSHVVLLADGKPLGEAWVGEDAQTLRFRVEQPGLRRFEIRFDNDVWPDGNRSFLLHQVVLSNTMLEDVLAHYRTLQSQLHCPDYPGVPEAAQRCIVRASVGRQTRPALFAAAPTEYRFSLQVPPQAELRLGGAVLETEHDSVGDGVLFVVEVAEGPEVTSLLRELLDPKRVPEHRRWADWQLPLDRWAGRTVELVLRTEGGDRGPDPSGPPLDLRYDAAAWSSPVLLRKAGAVRPLSFVLVSYDTLRADRLGAYGHRGRLSPHLDRFARQGTTFARCVAPAPYTVASHGSLFTSLLLSHHRTFDLNHPLPDRRQLLTLAEALRDGGHRTAGFVDPGSLSANLQFDQGFELYDEAGTGAEAVFDKGTAWLRRNADAPFFLFLHTYEIHAPYKSPPPWDRWADPDYAGSIGDTALVRKNLKDLRFRLDALDAVRERLLALDPPLTERDLLHLMRLYDAGVAHADAALPRLLAVLEETGRLQDTHLIFFSDHGEEFSEHGTFATHSVSLHAELLDVPLIWTGPQVTQGRVAAEPVGLVDIYPTVLELAGRPLPEGLAGRSLLPQLQGGAGAERQLVSERFISEKWGRSLATAQFKLIDEEATGLELYELPSDPGEQVDRHAQEPLRTAAVRELLHKHLAARPAVTPAAGPVEIDAETLEALQNLGYID